MDVTLLGKGRAALLCLFMVCLTGLLHAQQHTISSFSPSNANTGEVVTITGTNFSSITAVNFGGTAASSFTVVSTTRISATVAAGSSGSVTVVKTGFSNASSAGFVFSSYPTITRIISDYNGYWDTNTTTNNSVLPDNSHNLLAFTYGGTTYSTGVNNTLLTNRGVTYTSGSFKALPASLSGTTPASGASFFLAVGAKKDGSTTTANVTNANIRNLTPEALLVDGTNGLDLGTGYTNLPATALSSYTIKSIDPSKITDSEPDIVVTQIAAPSGSIDTFQFVKSDGTTLVGNAVTVSQGSVSKLGTWALDLFSYPVGVSYATVKPTAVSSTNTTREIRMVSFKLSDFGINGTNYNQIGFLKLTPSGTSDVAFIAYNANAINIPPVVTINTSATSSNICLSGTSPAYLSVNTISGSGASLSYSWEVSTNGGTSWSAVTNDSTYSGATTANLSITAGTNSYKYRATVYETATPSISAVSPEFTIVAQASSAIAGTINPGAADITMCLNDPAPTTTTLTVAPTGGVSTYSYQWQQSTTSATTGFSNISGANASTYDYPYSSLGTVWYRVIITSGCLNTTSLAVARKVITSGDSILSVTNNSRCNTGTVTLSATSVSGTSSNINWYAAETGGSSLGSNASFTTPSISSSTTYYAGTVTSSPTCNSVRRAVTATIASGITLSSTNFSVPSTTTVCPGSGSTVYVSTTALPDETYTVTYSVAGANTITNATASLTLVNGFGTFTTSALNTAGSNFMSISNVQNGAGCNFAPSSGNSNYIVVNAASVGGSIAGGATVCTGTNSTNLTLSGHTGSITKWQSSSSSDFSTGVSDIANTTTSLSASNLTATTYYRAVVANASCASANSSSATVTVSPTSVGGSVSGGTTVCTGTNSTDLTLNGNTGNVSKWQSSTSSDFSTGVSDISNTTTSYTATNLTATTYYRAVVTSGACDSANSSSATVTVNATSVGGSVS
ncbi:MAG: hypothetical protein CFE24_08775, partial [Flavobacterium sp. BFFFF2]